MRSFLMSSLVSPLKNQKLFNFAEKGGKQEKLCGSEMAEGTFLVKIEKKRNLGINSGT